MGKFSIYLPQERYVEALMRQRLRILHGLVELAGEDDETPGCKSTSCTWGLCSDETAAWPDAQDHLWPDQFEKHGRVAPLYREHNQLCPLDRRPAGHTDPNGCFYTCMFFKPRKGESLARGEVVKLYDKRLHEATA